MKIEDIEKAFDCFEIMQDKHYTLATDGLALFEDKRGAFPEILRWKYERERAFKILSETLLRVKKISDQNERIKISKLCESRLLTILNKEDKLKEIISKSHDRLGKELNRLRQGKTALKGYGNAVIS